MGSANDEAEAMRNAIADVYAKFSPDETSSRGIITNFVVIAEVMGDDGNPWLKRINDDNSPMWRTLGMLNSVVDDIRVALQNLN